MIEKIDSGAIFSPCRKYRYDLWRTWHQEGQIVAFIGLNPSTADETIDDPTIRRCVGYAKAWGYGTVHMLNLFAFRSTDPRALRVVGDPVGPDNDEWIRRVSMECAMTVAAWGSHGKHMNRGRKVLGMVKKAFCLKVNADGQPAHPLYLKKDLVPVAYRRN